MSSFISANCNLIFYCLFKYRPLQLIYIFFYLLIKIYSYIYYILHNLYNLYIYILYNFLTLKTIVVRVYFYILINYKM